METQSVGAGLIARKRGAYKHPWQAHTLYRNLGAMRAFHICCVIVSLLGIATPAFADQNDPRLEDLFASLKQVSEPAAAARIEQQIWIIWLETSDQDAAALLSTGSRQMSRGDYADALETFDKLVRLAPDFAEAWNKRATVHYLMDDLKRSLEDIDKTLELEPRHFGALSGRGLVHIKREDLERALAAFEETLAVHPLMPGPRANIDAIRKVLKSREI